MPIALDADVNSTLEVCRQSEIDHDTSPMLQTSPRSHRTELYPNRESNRSSETDSIVARMVRLARAHMITPCSAAIPICMQQQSIHIIVITYLICNMIITCNMQLCICQMKSPNYVVQGQEGFHIPQ